MSALLKNGFSAGGVLDRTMPDHLEGGSLVPDSIDSPDEKWMAFALLEAMNGIGWAAPNPSVGCVVVKGGVIIARGFTQNYGGKHAERMAFESLRIKYNLDSLSDLHVYVTLEPCSHFGKQPPCVDLLFHPAVSRVIVGCGDPNPVVSGRGIQQLKKQGKAIVVGVLENEVRAWHFPFLKKQIDHKPIWVAKWAENQDGLLADAQGNSKWITNERSRAYTHWLRQKYDAILVGAGTWILDQPRLNVRDCAEPHRRSPVILIHDPSERLTHLSTSKSFYVFHQKSPTDLIKAVEEFDFGFELQSVFCEGGARTLNELFRVGGVDLVHRFIGHKDFGASKHRITEFQPERLNSSWKSLTVAKFGNDHLQEWVKCS